MDNTPNARSNQETETVPHSGTGGYEKPVDIFDNTPLHEAVEDRFTDANGNIIIPNPATHPAVQLRGSEGNTDSYTSLSGEGDPNKKKGFSKKAVLSIIGGAITAAVAIPLALGITSQNQNEAPNMPPEVDPNQNSQIDEEPSVPQAGELPADIAEVLNNPNRIKASDVAGFNENELRDFTTITIEEAPTPELFAEQYNTVLDAWNNAGNTAAEYAPFENAGKDVFESAMGEKYDSVFIQGLFADSINPENFIAAHSRTLNGFNIASMVDPDKPYDYGTLVVSSEVVDQGEGGFIIDITKKAADNLEQTGASEMIPRKNINETYTTRVSVSAVDGAWKVTDSQTVN